MAEIHDYKGKLILKGSHQRVASFEEVGGKWNQIFQAWEFPAFYFVIDEILKKYPDAEIKSPLANEMFSTPNGFHVPDIEVLGTYDSIREQYEKLYPYQKLAVRTLAMHPYKRMMLALSPGLGKTPTSIVAAQAIGAKKILVICPLILTKNWQKEFRTWSNYDAKISHGEGPKAAVTITNYETVVGRLKLYSQKWDLLIVDESIMIKNYRKGSNVTSQRAMAVAEVAKKSSYVWELSGGPISNHAGDLHGQFRVMYPSVFPSYWKFVTPICEIERDVWSTSGRYGGKVVATKPSANIRERFKDVYFARSMEEVAPEIPDYIFQNVPVELGSVQAASYNQALMGVLKVIDTNEHISKIFNKLEEMIRLQQALSNPACFGGDDVSAKRDYIVQSIQNNSYELPMLIFAHWRYTVVNLAETLQKEFPRLRVAYIVGGMNNSAEIAEQFENGELDILVLSIQAGKYGLNFPLTKTVVMHDRIWDADAMLQATFRARRRTTKHSPVWVSLYVPDTIDEYLRDILEVKFKSIEQVTGTDILRILER